RGWGAGWASWSFSKINEWETLPTLSDAVADGFLLPKLFLSFRGNGHKPRALGKQGFLKLLPAFAEFT
ncbi:MAG TPA: hypothetical protein VNA24_19480, partial [Hyalangium sp.]|nr:hypothetical protein [Hyalangium sp.]